MRVLIACEESGIVTEAFRKRGHEAYSCDLLPTSGNHPEWHLMGDILTLLKTYTTAYWDLIIIHIPCTKVAVSGNRWYGKGMKRHHERLEYLVWANEVWELCIEKSKKCVLENPVSVIFSELNFDDVFYIQPWQFGHGETKKTGLGTVGMVKRLVPTNIVNGREQRIWKMPPSEDRGMLRSKTLHGIANAFAQQWG